MSTVQVDVSHYQANYNTRERYYSYVEQILIVQRIQPREVIEIGLGTGFVSRELRSMGLRVNTVDIDPELNPDVVGSIDRLPFADDCCDLIFCCQVLEHLPFEKFGECLRELGRVARRHVVVSVPNVSSAVRLELARGYAPVREHRFVFSGTPWRPAQPHVFDGQHYWEIGKQGYPLSRVESVIADSGLKLIESYRLHLNPFHQFFVLEK
jgi:2-polyprenyl-3-methyl-5-hydroxy-6-metoxy-1,4-benzoquinol methylase